MKKSLLIAALLAGASLVFASAVGCGSKKNNSFVSDENKALPDSGPLFGDAGGCKGLQCNQKTCTGGADTTLTGTVYAPNGTLPLYNAIVYVPNATPDDLPVGATCDQCGAVTGEPLVTALTKSDGTFELKNMPSGKDIPLVIQIGKWRRQVTIPEVNECEENVVKDRELTRLPRNQKEGNMPHIALTTGSCDQLGCMLPKIGIDSSEYGTQADGPDKAVHIYAGSDFNMSWPAALTLWGNATKMKEYDMLILSCECNEALESKGGSSTSPAFAQMAEYLNSGGRIFTTDYQYTWYRYSADPNIKSATAIRGGAPPGGSPMTFDSSFPKGKALVEWLQKVGATPTPGQLTPDIVYANIMSVDPSKAQLWSTSGAPLPGPRLFTINTPVGVPADQQCGKGVHIDAHLNNSSDHVDVTFPAGCGSALRPGENLLAFFFFDLASCIQDDTQEPQAPVK